MTSTGNDIVAFTGDRRPMHAALPGKILIGSELKLFTKQAAGALSFEQFTWLMWSAKEAVYKFLQRTDPALRFSPKKITLRSIIVPPVPGPFPFGMQTREGSAVNLTANVNCEVQTGNHLMYTSSQVFPECIHTIASNDPGFQYVRWGIQYTQETGYPQQSEKVRRFLLQKLANLFPLKKLSFGKKTTGHPYLLIASQECAMPISFSHHENFIAYSFVLTEEAASLAAKVPYEVLI